MRQPQGRTGEFGAGIQEQNPEPPAGNAPETPRQASQSIYQRRAAAGAPIPPGFIPVCDYPEVGVYVNKGGRNLETSAIQFAQGHEPTPQEKAFIQYPNGKDGPRSGISWYKPHEQWPCTDAASPGANLLKVRRIGQAIADGRRKELGISRER
jgi:hypothetical protein